MVVISSSVVEIIGRHIVGSYFLPLEILHREGIDYINNYKILLDKAVNEAPAIADVAVVKYDTRYSIKKLKQLIKDRCLASCLSSEQNISTVNYLDNQRFLPEQAHAMGENLKLNKAVRKAA